MEYYSGSGYRHRTAEPYKLIFKEENWYLLAYADTKDAFRLFKLNRMTDLKATREHFVEQEDYEIPALRSDFSNEGGCLVKVRMDKSLEFLAVDFLIQKTSRGMGMICSLPSNGTNRMGHQHFCQLWR